MDIIMIIMMKLGISKGINKFKTTKESK